MPRLLIILSVLIFFHGYSLAQAQYHKVELYFGLSENGKKIPEKKWRRFVDGYITPKFPDGMTIIDANGQWRNQHNDIIKERTKVVILIALNDSHTDSMIQTIRRQYCELYHQESVLEADMPVDTVRFK